MQNHLGIPRTRRHLAIRLGWIVAGFWAANLLPCVAAEAPDLAGYRTVQTAIAATVTPTARAASGQPGYLGAEWELDKSGRCRVTDIAAGSPAAQAGLQAGDTLVELDLRKPRSGDDVREWIQQAGPGAVLRLRVERNKKSLPLTATLETPSRPMKLASARAVLGVRVNSLDDGEGLRVTEVTAGQPAAQAGLKTGDVLLRVDDLPLLSATSLTDALATREPGEQVRVVYRRGLEELHFETRLVAAPETGGGEAYVPRRTWKKDTYRLAVIGVEFADTPHNGAITTSAWEELFLSADRYSGKTNVTGQTVYGSVNDYYREVSCGQFHFEGRVFDWVRLSRNRADYSQGTASRRTRAEFFGEALDALLKRDGAEALKDFDGLAFIYAGERFATANRGTLFWPHRATTTYKGKTWPYVICPEGGKQMGNISVFCHEFGHILGLPDLYARAENPGSEGVGAWCAMSNQAGRGRPQHFSAWCKAQLGWLHPTTIDPRVKQKLILSPVESSTNECYQVLLRPDGSEYLLLENRQKRGFDQSLPAAGLLIWRVVGNRLILEESHGVEGPSGPRVFLSSVPFPSAANRSFTPYTTPSSRAQLGGGLPVYLTDIRQLADGRITFQIGYNYQ